MNELFEEFLFLSVQLRTRYLDSLGEENCDWEKILSEIDVEIPQLFRVIYGKVSGTKRSIEDQTLMDFIPGYRLIHICELKDEFIKLKKSYTDNTCTLIPFLGNYSSDYICYCRNIMGQEYIGSILHDDMIVVPMHKDIKKFFETICAFYKNDVYFLDSDGYLDYNIELEGEIGEKINPGIAYWME